MDYVDCIRFGGCLKEVTKDWRVSLCDSTWADNNNPANNNSTGQNFMEDNNENYSEG
jgi:hypothetical protein